MVTPKTLIYLSLLLSGCTLHRGDRSVAKVVGGADGRDHRFLVALVDQGSRRPFCAGSLISATIVVTAAHCVRDRKNPLQVARLNNSSESLNEADVAPVAGVYLHPEDDPVQQTADIALLRIGAFTTAAGQVARPGQTHCRV